MLWRNSSEAGSDGFSTIFADSSRTNRMPGKCCRKPGSGFCKASGSCASHASCRLGRTSLDHREVLTLFFVETLRAEPVAPSHFASCARRPSGEVPFTHGQARGTLPFGLLEDLSVEEIAEVVEIPVGTVRSRLDHAKRALKDVLEREAGNYE